MNMEKEPSGNMDPMLQHLLETNLQERMVTQKLAQSLKVATSVLPTLLSFRQLAAASVPLPNYCQKSLPVRLTSHQGETTTEETTHYSTDLAGLHDPGRRGCLLPAR